MKPCWIDFRRALFKLAAVEDSSKSDNLENGGRFERAIALFDEANDRDPNRVEVDGEEVGYELFFARQLHAWTRKLDDEASEALLLATRCQHICRWESPRSDYPEGRAGYLKWRADLKQFHAAKAAEILRDAGYGKAMIEAVTRIVLKRDLKRSADSQTMEDALCLVFLEKQFAGFSAKTDEEKMVTILRKTWAKMSERGRQAALQLELGEKEQALVGKALNREE